MKHYHYQTSILLTFLLASLLALLSACGGSPSSSGVSPSPTATSTATADRPPQAASPRGSAALTLNGKKISVDYGRPSMRGRKIMGGLVPYDEVWRTGANEATQFMTESDLLIGNVTVPKGTYTLYTLPSAKGWKLIINKHTGQWGVPYAYEKEELARIDMSVETLPSTVEQFTISLEQAGEGGMLKMEWEQTRAAVNFTVKK